MSSVRISFTQKEIDCMLDILNHVKDHNQWMVETFDNGEKIYNVCDKFNKAYNKPEPEKTKC
ncbi:hypothetical protein SBF1_750015 [Candidatus Desulfosporosinus infrequens]|uniref:Uncharacterized protein n=1 Tax=Candidatus Desulfosporosinus infrequens TaxID=2043169 RepID=A0A2U3LRC4_9FIRM|nr:hypothetical protein SBF1_750015 [Candidatus Desulfosporosinus infrequens]